MRCIAGAGGRQLPARIGHFSVELCVQSAQVKISKQE